jgi:hypothetical protein
VKLVHLFGLILKKFVTMHGHTNVKKQNNLVWKTEGVRGIIEEMNDERNDRNRFPQMERT